MKLAGIRGVLFFNHMDHEIKKTLMNKAGALLARRSYTRGELRAKLSKAAGESEVEAALNRLEQLNLLNDADYAYNFALCRMKHDGWGPTRIMESLLRRQVSQGIVETALDRVRTELGDVSALKLHIEQYCKKTGLPADLKQTRKLIAHLRRRGFEEDSIWSALRQMIPAALLQRFETGE